MALPIFSRSGKKRDQIVAIDFGARSTKAVQVLRRHEGFSLASYAVVDSPNVEKGASAALLTGLWSAIMQKLGGRTRQVVLTVGVAESVLRWTEMPMVPLGDMRLMLKLNAKTYLQQELADHVFDCHLLLPATGPKTGDAAKGPPKCRVLVGGAKRQLVEDYQNSARGAGLVAEMIMPGLIGPANAFEFAQPESFAKDVVGLVDLGFKSSSISILQGGELKLSRVVNIGGDRITASLADGLGVGYVEAESIKIGLPQEVQTQLQGALGSLGRELRASIDFFEHQEDKTVTVVYLSGAAARSEFFVQTLQSELMVPCKTWNPVGFMQPALAPELVAGLEPLAPQFAVAAGAALAAF